MRLSVYVGVASTLYVAVVAALAPQWRATGCPVQTQANHSNICECLSFDEIRCRHLDKVPTFIGNGREYSAIFMSHQNIPGIPRGAFFDLRVRKIVLNWNPLGNGVNERAFSGLGETLVELQMGGCRIKSLPDRLFQGLQNVRVLHLWGNKLDKLPTGIFRDTPQLDELLLWGNRIRRLDDMLFSGLGNLLRLDLDCNRLTDLDRESFRHMPKLEALRLGGNKINSLFARRLEHLTNLKVLNLDSNGLAFLFPEAFAGLSGLRSLRMRHNQIDFIPDSIFKNLRNLTSLLLHDNKLKTVWPRTFDGLDSLQVGNGQQTAVMDSCVWSTNVRAVWNEKHFGTE